MSTYINDDNFLSRNKLKKNYFEFNPEWFSAPLDLTDCRNRFITLQFNPLQYEFNNCNALLKQLYWSHQNSKQIELEPQFGRWGDEGTIPSILDHLYSEEGRFSQESMTENDLKCKQMRYLDIVFYSFSDVVSLLGESLGNYLSERRQSDNKLLLSEIWFKLPHLIRDKNTNLDWPLNVRLVDWYDIDYSSLVEMCRASNIELPDKGIIEKYKGFLELARMSSAKRNDLIKSVIYNKKFPNSEL